MSDNAKYYYLKLKENFFDLEEMKILKSMDNGFEYACILMEMYLKSLKNQGRLVFQDAIPYSVKMLSVVLGHNVDTLEKAIKVLRDLRLIEVLESGEIYLLNIQNYIGKSSTEADRIRVYRQEIETKKLLSSSANVITDDVQMYDEHTPEIKTELKPKLSIDTPIVPLGDEQKLKSIDYQMFIDHYHEQCREMSKIIKLTDSRKRAIKARVKEYGVDAVMAMFEKAGSIDFLNGDNDREWKADFDWLVKPANFVKVVEGKYDKLGGNANGTHRQRAGTDEGTASGEDYSVYDGKNQKMPWSYDVPNEVLQANMEQICEAEDKADLCRECEGLANCRQETPGMFPVVDAYLGRVGFSMSFCEYESAERSRKRLERLFTFSRVPPQYAGMMLTDYTVTPANEKAFNLAKWAIGNNSKGVLLHGTPGTGKSFLAAIMVNEIIRRGRVAMFASLPDLLNDIRNSYDAGNTAEVIKAVNEAPFLVLDDLGAERMTPWVGEQLFSLINSRLAGKRQTVITSNFSPSQLIMRMQTIDGRGNVVDDMQGKRIMSRINEMCYIVPMNGKDWRAGK